MNEPSADGDRPGELMRLQKPPRRVLFFGKSRSRTRATGGLVEALSRHGLDVRWLKMAKLRHWLGREGAARRARRVFEKHRPELVFVSGRDLPRDLLEEFARQTTVVLWVEEALPDIGPEHVDYFANADIVFMTNPSKFEWLREQGVTQTAFVLEGFSSTWHYPVPAPRKPKRDVVFIGGPGLHGCRVDFLAEIGRRHDLVVHGAGWERYRRECSHLRVRGPVGPRGYRELCASSRIVLGLNEVNDDSLYFSNRTVLTLACRGFHLTHYVPRLETVFEDRRHLVWYHDLDDCLAKIEEFLARPEERERIARAGWEYALQEHQFDSRIAYILEVLRTGILPAAEPSGPLVPVERRELPTTQVLTAGRSAAAQRS